ncbi:MAG: DNA-binding protein WhiA, partial [Streptococcaceae bacterium]|nr:DNA-binding protein WhiA [Streptococcaceae bacterium]
MSFASDVKKELTEHTATKGTLMALIRMTGSLGITGHLTLSMVTESATTAKYIYQLFLEIYQLRADIRVHQKTTLSKNRVYTVVIEERVTELLDQLSLADSLMLETGMPLSVMESSKNQIIDDSEDYMEQEDRENLAIDYLRGAFLATGSMHNPEQGDYQLSIGSFYQEHAEDLQDILSNLGFDGKIIARKNRFILYLSKSEEIMDFLTLIGA